MHFWATLIVLGVGWNFSFIGASALVLETHRPQERNKVQAFNDFLVFGMMAIGSFSSGQLLAQLRLVRGEHGGVPAGAARPRRALAGVLCPPPQGAAGRGDGRVPGCDLNWREAVSSVDSSIQVEVIFG